MKHHVRKAPRVVVCRRCGGNGHVLCTNGKKDICPQCEGSGRCVVSCEMDVTIEPFKPEKV